jgi:hypothetical protein
MVSPEMSAVLEYLSSNPPRLGASVAERRVDVDTMLGGPLLDGTVEAADEVQLEVWPDLSHVWHLMGPDVPQARDALELSLIHILTLPTKA